MNKPLLKLLLLLLSLTMSLAAQGQQVINASIVNETPDGRYNIHGDGTVTDSLTGLMWKQCSDGLSDSACGTGVITSATWQAALDLAAGSSDAGYTDWRLPNIEELRTLVAYDRYNPSINLTVFPATVNNFYWSSSPRGYHSANAWGVNFFNGDDHINNRDFNNRVRLVRGGQ